MDCEDNFKQRRQSSDVVVGSESFIALHIEGDAVKGSQRYDIMQDISFPNDTELIEHLTIILLHLWSRHHGTYRGLRERFSYGV